MAVRTSSKGSTRRKGGSQATMGVLILAAAIVSSAVIVGRRAAPAPAPAPVVAAFDLVALPVPVKIVPPGTKVRDVQFHTINFPKHQLPQGALTSMELYLDATVIAPLPANLPVFPENFAMGDRATNPVVERIPPGMRAMTLRVDATTAVEGWAGSGSMVDVLLVEKDKTTVVAEKVKILSAERSVSPVDGANVPNVPTTVTLLVTQEQCLAINTAIPLGRIAFALRNASDEEQWGTTTYTADRLKGAGSVLETRESVTGVVTVTDQAQTRSFALSGGKWIKAESVPNGFFVGREDGGKGQDQASR